MEKSAANNSQVHLIAENGAIYIYMEKVCGRVGVVFLRFIPTTSTRREVTYIL